MAVERREASLQQEIAGLKAALAGSEKGRAEAEMLLGASRKECAGLQEALVLEKGKKDALQTEKQILENDHIRLQAEYDGLLKRVAQLQEQYSKAQGRILELEKNAVALDGQIESVHEKLRSAEDRVATLEHEKLFYKSEIRKRNEKKLEFEKIDE